MSTKRTSRWFPVCRTVLEAEPQSHFGLLQSRRCSVNVCVVASREIDNQIAELGGLLQAQVDDLALLIVAAIHAEVEFYHADNAVSGDSLFASARDNLSHVFRSLEGTTGPDLSSAVEIGRLRAEQGVPLASVMDSFRIAAHQIWQSLSEAIAGMSADAALALAATEKIWSAQDSYTEAMSGAYRDHATARAIDDEAERAALVEALLEGHHLADYTRWDIARMLAIPAQGPYVVVAAQPPMPGRMPLPDIAGRLRTVDVYSAWRLLPDVHIGLVHVGSRNAYRKVVELLGRVANTPVGVSPQFDDLTDTAVSMRYARLAMQSVPSGMLVKEFDDSVLGVAAVSAPDVTRKIAEVVLGKYDSLQDADKELLAATFRAWMLANGSVDDAAEALSCHPNTVRYRLRRIEQVTQRSLRVPKELTELCLAFEIADRL